MNKTIAVVGLGKMGKGVAQQLAEKGWTVYGWNRTFSVAQELESDGVIPVEHLKDLVEKLPKPRVIWMMVPDGKPVDHVLFEEEGGLVNLLEAGDIIVDSGNTFYKDTILRHQKVVEKGIHFVDVGMSGGPKGARNGACLMIGGEKGLFQEMELLYKHLSVDHGYKFFPGVGAGHFSKMVHNGIEYGIMQSIAEGFAVLQKAPFSYNLRDVADIYQHGSVIEGRLMNLLGDAFDIYGEDLEDVSGEVTQTGEGANTVKVAEEFGISIPAIEDSVQFRTDSQGNPSYTGQIVSALRNRFGGHSIQKI